MYSELVTIELENNKSYSCSKLAIEKVAKECGVSDEVVRNDMRDKRNIYLYDFSGFIDGKVVGRITLLGRFRRLVLKIYKKIEKQNGYKMTVEEKKFVLEFIELSLTEGLTDADI
jgi:hypothetical protein